jgi:(1->4)-alpha-D-glucan 1-alpha-D-glucosylmutase
MLYQALLGAWPLAGIESDFAERIKAFVVKAAREGKQETSWLAPNERYENGLTEFVDRVLDLERSASFIDGFDAFARRVALMGALNSLAQLALKATMPGVPEFWDLSLVDPDNRRSVDFAARASTLASIGQAPDWPALAGAWPDGRIKLALTRSLLTLRSELADLFTNGAYRPLEVVGPNRREIVAFARVRERDAVIVVTGRFFGRATQEGRRWPPSQAWNASILAEGFSAIRTVLPAGKTMTGPRLPAADLFEVLPIAVLHAQHTAVRGERTKVRVSAAAK